RDGAQPTCGSCGGRISPPPIACCLVGLLLCGANPVAGPPPERQINLSNVRAPTLARRAGVGQVDARDVPDEPWAFPAREFLRRKLIGKEVCFVIEHRRVGGEEMITHTPHKTTQTTNLLPTLTSPLFSMHSTKIISSLTITLSQFVQFGNLQLASLHFMCPLCTSLSHTPPQSFMSPLSAFHLTLPFQCFPITPPP
uniref:Uncharacterized protein n=1 Tax=Eptatretus burgeri TaxID=7764 RepID=A0A8C4R168_EPTBU